MAPAPEPRYFWLLANSFTRWLWKDFAHHLHALTGLKPLLIVGSELDRSFYVNQHGEAPRFDIVVQEDPYRYAIRRDIGDDEAHEIIDRAKEIEDRFGITIEREMLLADRNLGRGFLLAGSGHPRSRLADVRTLEGALLGVVEVFDQAEELFERYPPAFVASYYGGGWINGKAIALNCRARSVPFRAFCPARFGGFVYWAEDEYEGNSALTTTLGRPEVQLSESEIREIREAVVPSGLSTNKAMREKLLGMIRWRGILRAVLNNVMATVYGRIRGYFLRVYGNSIASSAAYAVRVRRHWKLLNKIALQTLPPLPGRKLVYFPLQQEPEQSTLVLAPENANQIALVMELALSLPADALLIVKEHVWQLGRRSGHIYRSLLDMPNVILMHPMASSIDIIKRADLVCTISSSAGYEAAALGKKTVFFWKRTPLRTLGHVTVMPGGVDSDRIAALLESDGEDGERRRRNAGALFYRRLTEFCFDITDMRFFGRITRPSKDDLDLLSDTLLDTLPQLSRRRHSAIANQSVAQV